MGESFIGTSNASILSSQSSNSLPYSIIAIPIYQLEVESNKNIKLSTYISFSNNSRIWSMRLPEYPIRFIRAFLAIDTIDHDVGPESMLTNGTVLSSSYDDTDISKSSLSINTNKVFTETTVYSSATTVSRLYLDDIKNVYPGTTINGYTPTTIAFRPLAQTISSIDDAFSPDAVTTQNANIVAIQIMDQSNSVGSTTGFTGYAAVCLFLIVYYA